MRKHRELTYYSVEEEAQPQVSPEPFDEQDTIENNTDWQARYDGKPRRWGVGCC